MWLYGNDAICKRHTEFKGESRREQENWEGTHLLSSAMRSPLDFPIHMFHLQQHQSEVWGVSPVLIRIMRKTKQICCLQRGQKTKAGATQSKSSSSQYRSNWKQRWTPQFYRTNHILPPVGNVLPFCLRTRNSWRKGWVVVQCIPFGGADQKPAFSLLELHLILSFLLN